VKDIWGEKRHLSCFVSVGYDRFGVMQIMQGDAYYAWQATQPWVDREVINREKQVVSRG
jgi:hypothetical protein